jgi:hypothetical protein
MLAQTQPCSQYNSKCYHHCLCRQMLLAFETCMIEQVCVAAEMCEYYRLAV